MHTGGGTRARITYQGLRALSSASALQRGYAGTSFHFLLPPHLRFPTSVVLELLLAVQEKMLWLLGWEPGNTISYVLNWAGSEADQGTCVCGYYG